MRICRSKKFHWRCDSCLYKLFYQNCYYGLDRILIIQKRWRLRFILTTERRNLSAVHIKNSLLPFCLVPTYHGVKLNLRTQDEVLTQKHCEWQPYASYTPHLSSVHRSGVVVLTLAWMTMFSMTSCALTLDACVTYSGLLSNFSKYPVSWALSTRSNLLSGQPQCNGFQLFTPSVNGKAHHCTRRETTISTLFLCLLSCTAHFARNHFFEFMSWQRHTQMLENDLERYILPNHLFELIICTSHESTYKRSIFIHSCLVYCMC